MQPGGIISESVGKSTKVACAGHSASINVQNRWLLRCDAADWTSRAGASKSVKALKPSLLPTSLTSLTSFRRRHRLLRADWVDIVCNIQERRQTGYEVQVGVSSCFVFSTETWKRGYQKLCCQVLLPAFSAFIRLYACMYILCCMHIFS